MIILQMYLRKIRADIFQAYKMDLGYAEAKKMDNNCDVFVDMFLKWMKKNDLSSIEPTPISISEEEGDLFSTDGEGNDEYSDIDDQIA